MRGRGGRKREKRLVGGERERVEEEGEGVKEKGQKERGKRSGRGRDVVGGEWEDRESFIVRTTGNASVSLTSNIILTSPFCFS